MNFQLYHIKQHIPVNRWPLFVPGTNYKYNSKNIQNGGAHAYSCTKYKLQIFSHPILINFAPICLLSEAEYIKILFALVSLFL